MDSLPSHWDIQPLGQIADIVMGLSPKGDSYSDSTGVPLLNGAADFEGVVLRPKKRTTRPTRLCKQGDILLCIRATLGNCTVADREYCIGRGVGAIRLDKGVADNRFIIYQLEHRLQEIKDKARGSTIVGIKKDDLLTFPISLAPLQYSNRNRR